MFEQIHTGGPEPMDRSRREKECCDLYQTYGTSWDLPWTPKPRSINRETWKKDLTGMEMGQEPDRRNFEKKTLNWFRNMETPLKRTGGGSS